MRMNSFGYRTKVAVSHLCMRISKLSIVFFLDHPIGERLYSWLFTPVYTKCLPKVHGIDALRKTMHGFQKNFLHSNEYFNSLFPQPF